MDNKTTPAVAAAAAAAAAARRASTVPTPWTGLTLLALLLMTSSIGASGVVVGEQVSE